MTNTAKGEPPITTGETRREIDALWDSVKDLGVRVESGHNEMMVVSTQISYMVTILERLDRTSLTQAPVCAVRGARIDGLEKRIELFDDLEDRVSDLEGSNKILKWLLGIATTILTVVGGEKLMEALTK